MAKIGEVLAAVRKNNLEALEELHRAGYRFEGEDGTRALFTALRTWGLRTIARVLEMGADPNGKLEGRHPLEWWASEDFGIEERIRYLLFLILAAYGADLSVIPWGAKEQEGCWQAIEEARHLDEYLSGERLFKAVQALGLLSYRNKYGESLLHVAAQKEWPDFVRQAVGHLDFNERTTYGRTPLHIAARARWCKDPEQVVGALLEGGADPNLLDEDGQSPLTEAILWGNFDSAARIANAGGRLIAEMDPHLVRRLRRKLDEMVILHPVVARGLLEGLPGSEI
jgi:ankyrin repeat protein